MLFPIRDVARILHEWGPVYQQIFFHENPRFLKAMTMMFWSGFFVCSQIRLENIIVNVNSSDFIILINMIIPYLLTQSGTLLQQTSINFLKFWFKIFWNWDINISWNWDVSFSGWQCCITSIGFWIIQVLFFFFKCIIIVDLPIIYKTNKNYVYFVH